MTESSTCRKLSARQRRSLDRLERRDGRRLSTGTAGDVVVPRAACRLLDSLARVELRRTAADAEHRWPHRGDDVRTNSLPLYP